MAVAVEQAGSQHSDFRAYEWIPLVWLEDLDTTTFGLPERRKPQISLQPFFRFLKTFFPARTRAHSEADAARPTPMPTLGPLL
jgi:hypothetical protein